MKSSKSSVALSLSLFAVSILSACGDRQDAQAPSDVPPPPPASQTGPRATPIATPASEVASLPVGPGRPQPLQLKAGQTAVGKLTAPRTGKLVAFDVKLGNYFNSSTGQLQLELCRDRDQQCIEGSADLLTSLDNNMFTIVLEQPLEVAANGSLSFQLRKEGGDKDVVVWTYASTNRDAQAISPKEGPALEGRTAQLALRYAK
jgi:hypothetical protein